MKLETKEALDRYLNRGISPGRFLTAVLSNDLSEACLLADEENSKDLVEIVLHVYNNFPIACWTSPERVKAWVRVGGLPGFEAGLLAAARGL